MDRLKALSVFKAVADRGSFGAAASALDISVGAVSRTVQDLEGLLGARLLHRTTRRVALTAVGEDVLSRVGGLLRSYDELAAIGQLSTNEPAGMIRMAAPALFARSYLGSALAAFRERYPQVQVDLQLSEGSVNALLEEVDLAVCPSKDLRPTMIARPLASMEIGVYASPRYLARKGEAISPAQLVEHDCLTSKAMGAGGHWSFDHRHSGHPCTVDVKGVLHSNQVEVLVDAAVHGAGIVMLPAFIAQEAVLTGRLRRILQDWSVAPQALHLGYNSRRNQPMSVRKLIEHLVEHLGAKQDVESAQTRHLHYDEGTSSTTLLVEPAAAWRAPQALGAEGLASAG